MLSVERFGCRARVLTELESIGEIVGTGRNRKSGQYQIVWLQVHVFQLNYGPAELVANNLTFLVACNYNVCVHVRQWRFVSSTSDMYPYGFRS